MTEEKEEQIAENLIKNVDTFDAVENYDEQKSHYIRYSKLSEFYFVSNFILFE